MRTLTERQSMTGYVPYETVDRDGSRGQESGARGQAGDVGGGEELFEMWGDSPDGLCALPRLVGSPFQEFSSDADGYPGKSSVTISRLEYRFLRNQLASRHAINTAGVGRFSPSTHESVAEIGRGLACSGVYFDPASSKCHLKGTHTVGWGYTAIEDPSDGTNLIGGCSMWSSIGECPFPLNNPVIH